MPRPGRGPTWGTLEMLHTGSPQEPHSPCSVDVGCWGFLCPHPGASTRRRLEAAQSGKSQEALEVLQAPASSEVETVLVPLPPLSRQVLSLSFLPVS